MKRHQKKGITPIIAVIILLLITIAIAGAAYTYLTNYFKGLTGKTIQVADSYCQAGTTAIVQISNTGTETINLGAAGTCDGAGDITGTETVCGDLTIARTDAGGTMDGQLNKISIIPNEAVTFTDECTAAGSRLCQYRFVPAGGAFSAVSASVTCTG